MWSKNRYWDDLMMGQFLSCMDENAQQSNRLESGNKRKIKDSTSAIEVLQRSFQYFGMNTIKRFIAW